MKINFKNLQIAMAKSCMNPYDLCRETGIQYQTYRRIASGNQCKPATVGKLANALGVPVTDILESEV